MGLLYQVTELSLLLERDSDADEETNVGEAVVAETLSKLIKLLAGLAKKRKETASRVKSFISKSETVFI